MSAETASFNIHIAQTDRETIPKTKKRKCTESATEVKRQKIVRWQVFAFEVGQEIIHHKSNKSRIEAKVINRELRSRTKRDGRPGFGYDPTSLDYVYTISYKTGGNTEEVLSHACSAAPLL